MPSFFPYVCLYFCEYDDEGYLLEFLEWISLFTMFIRGLLLFILFWIYFAFFKSYKNGFENGFFELFDNINNNDIKIEFENYYSSFFDL